MRSRDDDESGQVIVHTAQAVAHPRTHAREARPLETGRLQISCLTVNAGFADDIVNECHVIHALAELRDDRGQRLAALAVLSPFPRRLECVAGGALEQLDGLAWIPFFAVPLNEFRLVVKQIQMTRRAAHEQLNHPLGLGLVMQANRVRGTEHAIATKHPGEGNAAQATARSPEKIASALRLAMSLAVGWFGGRIHG